MHGVFCFATFINSYIYKVHNSRGAFSRSRTLHRCRFVAAVSSPPFCGGYTSSPAISSGVHFVASHFVAGALRRRDTSSPAVWSWGHFVGGSLRRLPFRRGDTSSPAVSSRGHFVAGARRKWWNLPELIGNVTNSVQTVPIPCICSVS